MFNIYSFISIFIHISVCYTREPFCLGKIKIHAPYTYYDYPFYRHTWSDWININTSIGIPGIGRIYHDRGRRANERRRALHWQSRSELRTITAIYLSVCK